MAKPALLIRQLGYQDYVTTWEAMQAFTAQRHIDDLDEIWLLEHNPVFTLGQAGKHEHILDPGDIPVIKTDRGGQVTYHGPGQLIAYLMLNLKRLGIGPRRLVTAIETSLIELLASYQITATARQDAPGVYVDGKKIASLGLRIRNGYSFHGLSLNIDMDISPFTRINPCGYEGLEMTQLNSFVPGSKPEQLYAPLTAQIADKLEYTEVSFTADKWAL